MDKTSLVAFRVNKIRVRLGLLCVGALVTSALLLASAFLYLTFGTPRFDHSPTIAISKSQGYFLSRVSVQPKQFSWFKHSVRIRECWLEHPPRLGPVVGDQDQVIITFEIDDSSENEHKIAFKRSEFMELEQIGTSPRLNFISFYSYVPPDRRFNAILAYPGAFCDWVHYIDLDEPLNSNAPIRLRVGREITHDLSIDPTPCVKEWTDTILTLQRIGAD